MNAPLVILGAGGHAREILQVCRMLARDVVLLVDETIREVVVVAGINVVDSLPKARHHAGEQSEALCGVGDITLRRRFAHAAEDAGWRAAVPVVAPGVAIDPSVSMGGGCYVAPGALLSIDSSLGDHVVIGRGAIVSHDAHLGDFVTLSPGVALAGRVTIGHSTLIGIGTSVRDGVTIGHDVVVGGGSFVATDLAPGGVYAGVPARLLRPIDPRGRELIQ
jgi:sugar O-acyltransferase (sialic acid O-acetyltransferase NeuD family)